MYGQNYGVAQFGNPYQAQANNINSMYPVQQSRQAQYENFYGQNMQAAQQVQQPQFPAVRPVTGLEEVRAISIPFDGTVSYFSDKANSKIYTKCIDLNGLPQIQTYKLEITPTKISEESPGDFVSKKEFEELKSQMTKYEALYQGLMGTPSVQNEGGMASE